MVDWKNLTVTAGIIAGTSLGVAYLYKHSKSYWYNIHEKSPSPSSSRVTPRELMTVGGVTSIVGFALTFMNKESLDKLFSKDVKEITLPDDSIKPNWLAIPLQCNCRLELLTYLEEQDIQTRVTFAGNVTRHPIYREYLQEFNNSDIIMANGFLLGAHHGMDLDDVDYVCDKIKEFFKK